MTFQSENTQKNKVNKEDYVNPHNITFKGQHWTSPKFFNDNILIDALIKHTLSLARFGMTDLGEVLDVVYLIQESNEEIWLTAWSTLAQRLQNRAEEAEKNGKKVTASTAYLRAGTYWRCALLYYSDFTDPRMKEYAMNTVRCLDHYFELSAYPGQSIQIPYENTFLPGHFYRSPVAGDKAPLLILTPGRDTWADDLWHVDGALRRGIHCVTYDGPGQGLALRLGGLTFRNDWENVVGPVIDFVLEKFTGIDHSRIALLGMSMGGYLISRAAAFDKRIKLLIPSPGNISWGTQIIQQLKRFSSTQSVEMPEMVRNLVKDYAWKQGVPNTVKDVTENLKKFDNSDIIDQITCETLVLDGTAEVFHGAKAFYEILKCPKTYMCFDETTTAQSHGQIGGYATATEYLFDWLDARL